MPGIQKQPHQDSWQHKPLPTIPGVHQPRPGLKMVGGGAIENIPRQRTTSSTTASELIRRVSNIFSSRRGGSIIRRNGSTKRRPPALNLSHRGGSRVRQSSLHSLSDEDEEEDDIRRPSGLGSAVSISSLPPSPFSPSRKNLVAVSNRGDDAQGDNEGTGQQAPSHTPFGYLRARATSTPNLLRSFSLRSRGSKRSKKGRPRNSSGISSRDETTTEDSHSHHTHLHLPFRSATSLLSQPQATVEQRPPVTITSIPIETIALIFTYLDSKSSIAQIAHTCHLFLSVSRTVLYTHVNLDEFKSGSQLEKFVALLASRRDFTDLARTFSCATWPQFFLPTKPPPTPLLTTTLLSTPLSHFPSQSRSSYPGSSSPTHRTSPFLDHDHQDEDPDAQHRNTLLTATFTLAFQRMSNLTSLTLPAYDHDLLAYHTAFGLKNITFFCSTMSKEQGKELFGWLDGQINVARLEFPNLLVIDGGLEFDSSGDGEGKAGTSSGAKGKGLRPATSSGSGLLRQVSASAAIGGSGDTKVRKEEEKPRAGKKYLVAPYLVPLNSASSPKTPSPTTPTPTKPSPSPLARPRPRDLLKLSPRPKSAAPDSPSYATFSEAFAQTAAINDKTPSPLSSPTSQIPFPTSSSSSPLTVAIPTPSTSNTPRTLAPIDTIITAPPSPLSSPTLLPNLTTLHGPPSLIIALSSPPLPSTSPLSPSGLGASRRPLYAISLNITTTLYSGLRPATIMARLVGTTRVLSLRFGESVDRRSVEKVLGAAGSSLGGVRDRKAGRGGSGDEDESEGEGRRKTRKEKSEMKDGFKFGRGEWKGLTELNVSFVAGGPGSDEALHKMISSTIPRYPYLRTLTLTYLPPGSLSTATTHSTSTAAVSSGNTTNGLTPTSIGSHNNMLPTPPRSISPLPTTPTSYTSSTISALITPIPTPTTATSAAIVMSVPPRSDSLRRNKEKEKKDLSPPEVAYVRQWAKFCCDLERVVFLSGAEWVKRRK